MFARPRRPLVAVVAVVLVAALVSGTVGGAVGVLRLLGDRGTVAVPAVAEGFTVADLQVAAGWWLVAGGARTTGTDDPDSFHVLADVTVTNVGSAPRRGDFAVDFVVDPLRGEDVDGGVVATATCRAGALAPGESATLDCLGPRQVLPTDFDSIEVRPLG